MITEKTLKDYEYKEKKLESKKKEIQDKLENLYEITFDSSTHSYFLKDRLSNEFKPCISVSKIISSMEYFNPVVSSISCSKNQEHEFYGRSPEWIRNEWDRKAKVSIIRGNKMHDYIYHAFENTGKSVLKPDTDTEIGFDDFFITMLEKNIKIIANEKPIAHPKYHIAGTPDTIGLIPIKNKISLVLLDWKTGLSFSVKKDYKFSKPCYPLESNSLNKYTLQMYLYKFILEDAYNLKIDFERIVLLGKQSQQLIDDINELEIDAVLGKYWISFKPAFRYNKEDIKNIIIQCNERINRTMDYTNIKRGYRDDIFDKNGNKVFLRSSYEANFWRYLEFLKRREEIFDFEYEPMTFHFQKNETLIKNGFDMEKHIGFNDNSKKKEILGKNGSYKIDFKIWKTKDSYYWGEVKGRMDNNSKIKIARFEKYFPKEELIVYGDEYMKDLENKLGKSIQNWEFSQNNENTQKITFEQINILKPNSKQKIRFGKRRS